jgi:phosphotransferase system enzyme I (PtsI)
VVIRTFDLGADKLGQGAETEERNPFLGVRSIRLSLRNVPAFRCQLAAVLRASHSGNVSVMFPMITTLAELRQAKSILADCQEDLEERGLAYRKLSVGMMVEVPAAVMMIDQFLPEVDFVSIGTNDLVQYTLAVDRSNREVADLYRDTDPAVLRLIDQTVQAGRRHGRPVSLCGQMSANPLYTMLLLGMGLRSISVPPANIPEIKEICRSVDMPQCEHVARCALHMESSRHVDNFLREELKKVRSRS